MKKISIFFLMMALLLAGCGSASDESAPSTTTNNASAQSNEPADVENNTNAESEAPTNNGYVFEVDGVQIVMHAEAAPILDQLGKAHHYFEAEACAFPGLEKIYVYTGFELYTYEVDGVDYIASVVLMDDTVSTKEGITLFSTFDDVLLAYGDQYDQEFSLYTYHMGPSDLSFLIENGEVTSIEYMAHIDE